MGTCNPLEVLGNTSKNPPQSVGLFQKVFPLVFPYMEQKQILDCRMICKEWCRVVDTFLEDFESRRPFNKDTSDISRFCHGDDDLLETKGLRTHVNGLKKLSEFMREMETGRNPLIAGSLCVEGVDSFDSESHLFWEKVSQVLVMCGHHVKYMTLESNFVDGPTNGKEFYQYLCQYLRTMPSLRSLTVMGKFEFFKFEEDLADSAENCGRLRELKEFLESDLSTLAEISCLETLELATVGLPRSICEKLIDGINPHKLKCLKLSVELLSLEGTTITLGHKLQSLTELHLESIKSVEHLQHSLSNIVSVEAPLGKLVLNFEVDSATNFDLVCEAISKFGGTLQVLSVTGFDSYNSVTQLPNPRLSMLKIPNVRNLELDSLTFGPGPQFLGANFAPALEHLQILISHPDEGILLSCRTGPGTEFYKGAGDGELCNSTIWSQMPKLKVLKMFRWFYDKPIICTREMHEGGIRVPPLSLDEFGSSSSSESD